MREPTARETGILVIILCAAAATFEVFATVNESKTWASSCAVVIMIIGAVLYIITISDPGERREVSTAIIALLGVIAGYLLAAHF